MEFIDPQQVLDQLDLRDDMTVVEFGAGSGHFTIPLAQRVSRGRVIAFDVQREALEALQSKATAAGVMHIENRHADLELSDATKLAAGSVDVVLIPNMLFQVEDKLKVLEEACRITTSGGHIAVIDWHPTARMGPNEGHVTPDELKDLAKELPVSFGKELVTGQYHHGGVFLRK